MPTKFTKTTGKLLRLPALRRQCMQNYNHEMGIAWEYVHVLEYIKAHEGCMQTDISKKMNVSSAAVTQSTKILENAGMIKKKIKKDNLRVKQMYITEQGIETAKRGTEIFDNIDAVMYDGLTDEDIEKLENLLDRISQNLENHILKRKECSYEKSTTIRTVAVDDYVICGNSAGAGRGNKNRNSMDRKIKQRNSCRTDK